MKNQPLKPWIKGNESITPNNFFSNALPNLEYLPYPSTPRAAGF